MKLWQIIALVALGAAILAGIGYSYRAAYTAGDSNGYNRRVSQESGAYAAAEQKGREAQNEADQQTISQLRQAAADETSAAQDHDKQLANLRNSASSLQRRLHDLEIQSPDAQRWLAEPVPADVLNSVCWASAGQGAAGDCPGH